MIHTTGKLYLFFVLLFLSSIVYGQDKLNVVSSCSIFKDMAANIGGDKIELQSIVPIGGDPHLHSPTPRDARIVADADLVLINGMTFEGWIEELIDNSGTSGKTILITKGIAPIQSTVYENSSDPHAWMNAANGLIYIENIKNALIKADPKNESFYLQNYNSYKSELEKVHEIITQQVSTIPIEKRILVTSHDAFSYFGKAYGLSVEPIIGVSTEADVQTADMVRVAKVINKNKIPAVFVESTINPKILQQIAKDNDVEIGGELYADSLGESGSEGATYIGMLLHNAETVTRALSKEMTSTDKKNQSHGDSKFLIYGLALLGLFLLIVTFLFLKRSSSNA
jgi:ABC-type Zn uptake system ZnuABC Zn-binding protein ZnuA